MATIDFDKFSFSKVEEIRAIKELLFDEVLRAPAIEALHDIYGNIVTGKEVGWIGEGGAVGIKGQGCDPTPQEWKISTRLKQWDPQRWEVFLKICATEENFEQLMTLYSVKHRVEWDDLTDTDYMDIVLNVLGEAIHEMLWRLLWFGDKDAQNISDGGIITNGEDTKHFDVINGFWKQIFAGVPTTQKVSIAANNAATAIDQKNQLTGQMVYELLDQMLLSKAPMEARGRSDLIFACTQSVADGYQRYLQGENRIIESTYTNMVEGVDFLKYSNIPVIPFPIWDKLIAKYENTGTKLNNPHRIVLLPKAVLAVGYPSTKSLDDVKVWYNDETRFNFLRAGDKLDALLLNEELVTLGM